MDVSLFMFKENGESRSFKIQPGQTVIGRREDCDLRIPLGEISRKHAVLTVGAKGVTLRDLDSANGTYINNTRVSEQKLAPGDHIVIGPVVFTIQIDGEPGEVRPVKTRLEARSPGGATSTVLQKQAMSDAAGTDKAKDEVGMSLGSSEEDPISALEAMAGSEDTTHIDLDDSSYRIDDPES